MSQVYGGRPNLQLMTLFYVIPLILVRIITKNKKPKYLQSYILSSIIQLFQ